MLTRQTHRAVRDLNLDDETRVAVAGDWHGDQLWLREAIPAIRAADPLITTIVHVGDYGLAQGPRGRGFLNAVDDVCFEYGFERILVTPGNHDDWGRLTARWLSEPGDEIWLSDVTRFLPRGYRWTIGGRTFLSFGGAASLDRTGRRVGRDWWPEEMPRPLEVEAAVAKGPAEILITHEAINGGCSKVERVLETNPQGWDELDLEYSATSRGLVTRVWEGVRPSVLAHGHMHIADQVELASGQRVYSLGNRGQRKNLAILDLKDLSWTWVDVPRSQFRRREGLGSYGR